MRPSIGMRAWQLGWISLLALGLGGQAMGCQGAARPMVRLLYVDLDGTLLDDGGEVPPVNVEALARFQAAGGRVGIATGRMPERGLPHAKTIGADLPAIVANGAVILDTAGQVLSVQGIAEHEDVAAMCARITQAGCEQVYAAHSQASTGRVIVEMGICRPPAVEGQLTIKVRAKVCQDHAALLAELPVLTGGRYEIIEGGAGDHKGVSIGALEATKGKAISFVAARLGIPLSQVAFVGDSGNDLSAARTVTAAGGRCFAVRNAVPALKEVCPNHLPLTNAQGAVARAIDILLGPHLAP